MSINPEPERLLIKRKSMKTMLTRYNSNAQETESNKTVSTCFTILELLVIATTSEEQEDDEAQIKKFDENYINKEENGEAFRKAYIH